jgi:hypothetical protein
MQEMKGLGDRNRFLFFILALIRAPKERLPPVGVWPHALARVAKFPDFIFEVLRSKPKLVPSEDTGCEETAVEVPSEDTGCEEAAIEVPSEDTGCMEVAKDTGILKKRKRSDE